MKRVALSAMLGLAMVVPGMAADLRAPVYKAPPALPMVYNWTGFYIGGNAGATFGGRNSIDDLTVIGFTSVNFNNNNSNRSVGFTGGGQAGYNYQIGGFVMGIETDIQYLDRRNNTNNIAVPLTAAQYQLQQNSGYDNFFGTVRGRVGYAFDRVLVYATGGFAYGGGGMGTSTLTLGPATAAVALPANIYTSNSTNDNNLGFTVGGGLEYAFAGPWSVKGEYLYTSLGGSDVRFTNTLGQSFTGRVRNEFSVARVGLNYRF